MTFMFFHILINGPSIQTLQDDFVEVDFYQKMLGGSVFVPSGK